jgi:hypothetical protein
LEEVIVVLGIQNGQIVPLKGGFDQIVPEKTGTEYIFVKGLGTNDIERIF